jgi:hypothetical protein
MACGQACEVLQRKAGVFRETDDLEVESGPLSAERERDFEAWVCGRLSDWTYAEIRALDCWLLDEARFEFIPAVRAALAAK